MILKKILFLVFTVLVAYGSQAEQIEHPYFWKVEKDGKASYLLGTAHLAISIDELMCSQEMRGQLEKSDLVFLEADPYSKDFIEAERQQAQWAVSKDGREFQALSRESQEFLRSKGISETLNLYGYNAKLIRLCHRLEDEKGVDYHVKSIADSQKIPIQGLEDYYPLRRAMVETNRQRAEFYSQFSEVAFSMEIDWLDRYIKKISQICPPVDMVYMIEDYKSGFIVKVMTDMMMRAPRQVMQDLQERNSQWVDRFEKAHKSYEHIFVAGGLIHFLGPVSFINMLRGKGYKVEPVTCEK